MEEHRGKPLGLFLCKMGGSVWEGVNVGKQLEMLQKEQSNILEERRGTADEKRNLARWPQPPRYLGVFLAHTSLASRSRLSSK